MPTQLTDRLDIADLFPRLARLLDDHRPDDIHTIYAPDIVVHSPRTDLHGIDEITTFLRDSHLDGEHTQHRHTDILITLNGDQADASANQIVDYYRPGHPPHRTSSLHLAYHAIRTPSGWRFNKGNLTLTWTHDHRSAMIP